MASPDIITTNEVLSDPVKQQGTAVASGIQQPDDSPALKGHDHARKLRTGETSSDLEGYGECGLAVIVLQITDLLWKSLVWNRKLPLCKQIPPL